MAASLSPHVPHLTWAPWVEEQVYHAVLWLEQVPPALQLQGIQSHNGIRGTGDGDDHLGSMATWVSLHHSHSGEVTQAWPSHQSADPG